MRSVTSVFESSLQGIECNMAERLGLGYEVRELKLGPTFTNDRSTAFHTLKYDFKPASVDVSKMARVDIGTNKTMTVTVPHLDGADIPYTVFKGSQRPYHKECVLIIDRITGEITLEKLSSNVQVKKTRTELKPQAFLGLPGSNNGDKPATPIETKRSPTHGRNVSRTKVISGKKREPTVQLHPKQQSSLQVSSYHEWSPPNVSSNSSSMTSSVARSTLASLPMIGLDSDDFAPLSTVSSSVSANCYAPSKMNSPIVGDQSIVKSVAIADRDEGAFSDSSSSSSSSDNSDSDSDAESIPVPMTTNGYSNGTTSSPSLSMPDNLLNDDLQLSESESDTN